MHKLNEISRLGIGAKDYICRDGNAGIFKPELITFFEPIFDNRSNYLINYSEEIDDAQTK